MSEYKYTKIEFENDSVKKWWRPKIDKKKLKHLHQKRDLPAILNTVIYFSIKLYGVLQVLRGFIAGFRTGFSWYYGFYTFCNIFAIVPEHMHLYGGRGLGQQL